jgi:hypothetical protein
MKAYKKILRYTILLIIIFFIIFIVTGNILAHIYGYQKEDSFLPKVHYPIRYFKKLALEKITIESLHKNRFNDSLYVLQYADSFKIALWIIKQNKNVFFKTGADTNQERLTAEDYAAYDRLYVSSITLKCKASIHDLENVSIHFYNCKDIHPLIDGKSYQYYYLKAGAIYLTSNGNNYYDTYLGLNNSNYSNFMVFFMNSKLYIVVLFSKNHEDVSSDELKKIINFPLE